MLRELGYTFCRLCHCLNKHHSHIFFGLKIHHHMLPLCHLAIPIPLPPRGARVAQWWEHSPLTNVARVQIPASTAYVGWVCCWFSPLLREVFLGVLRFSPLLKKPTFPNSNSTRNQVNEEPLCGCATCKSLFIYLFNLEVCMMFDTWTYSRTSI